MSSSSHDQSPAEAGRKESKKGPGRSPVADNAGKPNTEAGYGAETHAAGEDFTHRAPWRKEQDADSRRGPAEEQAARPADGDSQNASSDLAGPAGDAK